MAIVSWPDDVSPQQSLVCIVCRTKKTCAELIVGLSDAEGHQAFACDEHFKSGSQFIVGWAEFAVQQFENTNAAQCTGGTDGRILH